MKDMASVKIDRLEYPPAMQVKVPGSKSITNRALLLAALADGVSVISGVQFSNDSKAFLEALKDLGFETEADEKNLKVIVKGTGGKIPEKDGKIYVASAGTAARFLTALLGLSDGRYTISASAQMSKRPMKELYDAMRSLGSEIIPCGEKDESFPVNVSGSSISKEKSVSLDLNIDRSSQFLSGLMMVLPLHYDKVKIHLTGKREARSYVKMTERMMHEFGFSGSINEVTGNDYVLTGGKYTPCRYTVEPDISAACYFYALAAVTGGTMSAAGVHRESMQGDIKFLDVLESMGCSVREDKTGLYVTGPEKGKLGGFSGDLSDMSDQALTLAAIAPFADFEVHVTGLGHIRKQESDRLAVIDDVMRRIGVKHTVDEDSFTIFPIDGEKYFREHSKENPVIIDTYNDHRVAMSFTVTALKLGNMIINDPMCCRKTFAGYYDIVEDIILQDRSINTPVCHGGSYEEDN